VKVLYLLPEWVLPADRGLRIMSYCLLKHLSREVECSVLGLNVPQNDSALPPELSRVNLLGSYVSCAPGKLWRKRLRYVAGLNPPCLARFDSADLHAALAGLVERFDVVHYNVVYMAQYFRPEVPSVLLAPDAYSMGYREAALERLSNLPGFLLRAFTMRRLEKTLYPKITRIVVVSKTDQAYLATRVDDARIDRVPLPVPEEYFNQTASFPNCHRILASGHYQAPGVLNGLVWYVREVHPLVRTKVRDARLRIVGDGIPGRIKKSLERCDGVEVLGFVPDYLAQLSQAQLYVCCDPIGTGTNTRVAQALALGKPVVGTRVSLRGLEVRDGWEAFVRDDAASFADAVIHLLQSPDLCRTLGSRAREFVRERHHPRTVASQMIAVYESAVRTSQSSPAVPAHSGNRL